MPWVIIRTLLSTQSRFYLQNCFHLALQQRMIRLVGRLIFYFVANSTLYLGFPLFYCSFSLRCFMDVFNKLSLFFYFQLLFSNIPSSPQTVSTIESHLLTSNSTEGWIVLNFICDKVKSKEPDALIHNFISLESVSFSLKIIRNALFL